MQSRLERKFDQRNKQKIALLLIGSVVLLGLFIYFGVPALFSLAGTISGLGGNSDEIVDENVILNKPSLSRDFEATKSGEISVRGTADPDSKVELLRNAISLGIETADKTGFFIFENVALEKGKNELVAQTVSNGGKKSSPSETYVVFLSTTGPKLELANKDADIVKESPYSVTGKVDPVDSSVTVNDRLAIVDSKGNFSYYLTLNSGDNKITVVTKDAADNETKQEINLKYEP